MECLIQKKDLIMSKIYRVYENISFEYMVVCWLKNKI